MNIERIKKLIKNRRKLTFREKNAIPFGIGFTGDAVRMAGKGIGSIVKKFRGK